MNVRPRPYALAAPIYWHAGWSGVLPLPEGRKAHPPAGYTGRTGGWPDRPQIEAWITSRPFGNIGLRLPEIVLGLDVDDYRKGDVVKRGAAELDEITEEVGEELPPTWVSTSRDLPSGIRLYRVPARLRFLGELSASIEIISHGYRYAVVWPSMNPDSGCEYRWHRPDGTVSDGPPCLRDLPRLPGAWVARVVDDSPPEVERPRLEPAPVPLDAPTVSGAVAKVMARPRAWTTGGRHPLAKRLAVSLARLEHLGYPGAGDALDTVRAEFVAAVDGERRKGEDEWESVLDWARHKVATTEPTRPILPYSEAREAGREKRRRERRAELERALDGWLRGTRFGGARHV